MEGIQFLWITWSIWVYIAFFCKAKNAMMLNGVLLFIIALFPYTFFIGDVSFSGAFLICLVYASSLFISETWLYKSYYLLLTVTITCAVVSFQLFEIYDPVSMLFDRRLMLAVVIVALLLAFPIRREKRIAVLLMGFLQAEFIYKDIVSRLSLQRTFGDGAFFDVLSLALLFLLIWQAFEIFTLRMSESLSCTKQSTVKSSVGE